MPRRWAGPSSAGACPASSAPLGSRFKSFGREAAAAASLGQVHRATLPDGTEVACKLQYPDMPSVVEADLRQLKLAMNVYRRMDSALDNGEVYQEMCDRLREELDYLREAAQCGSTASCWRDSRMSCPDPGRGLLHPPPADHDLAGGPRHRQAPGGGPAGRGAQRLCQGAVPRLVQAVLPLRRHPRRPASRQLPGAAGPGRDQPARLRHHPGLPAQLRRRRHHAVRGGARP